MNPEFSFLEIDIHTVEGPVSSFVQYGEPAIRRLLDQLHPSRIFAQHHLLIAGDHSIAVFPCRAIARVDLIMDDFPQWPFHDGVSDVIDLTEQEFLRRYRPEQYEPRRRDTGDGSIVAFSEIELANGERVFREVHLAREPRLSFEESIFLRHLISAPSLHSRRREGGVMILNPSHIVRWSFYPGPGTAAPNALSAEPLCGSMRNPITFAHRQSRGIPPDPRDYRSPAVTPRTLPPS